MPRKPDPIGPLVRQQLDRRFSRIREFLPALLPPQGGWIVTLRTALGMSQVALAHRMGVTQQTISQLENREADGNVTLEALDKAARALGGQLVYAIVPERPIADALEQRALNIARERTSSVRHSMRLENQEPDSDVDARAQELAKELLATPKKLW